jgi:hypothetical protein
MERPTDGTRGASDQEIMSFSGPVEYPGKYVTCTTQRLAVWLHSLHCGTSSLCLSAQDSTTVRSWLFSLVSYIRIIVWDVPLTSSLLEADSVRDNYEATWTKRRRKPAPG